MSCNCENLQSLDNEVADRYIEDYLVRVQSGKSIFACTRCRARWVLDYKHKQIVSSGTPRIRKLPLQQEGHAEE